MQLKLIPWMLYPIIKCGFLFFKLPAWLIGPLTEHSGCYCDKMFCGLTGRWIIIKSWVINSVGSPTSGTGVQTKPRWLGVRNEPNARGKFIPGAVCYRVHWSYCRKGLYLCLLFSLAQCKGYGCQARLFESLTSKYYHCLQSHSSNVFNIKQFIKCLADFHWETPRCDFSPSSLSFQRSAPLQARGEKEKKIPEINTAWYSKHSYSELQEGSRPHQKFALERAVWTRSCHLVPPACERDTRSPCTTSSLWAASSNQPGAPQWGVAPLQRCISWPFPDLFQT